MFLLQLIAKLDRQKVPYVVVGGYAMALQGIVRATMDIDLVVSLQETHLKAAEHVLQQLGLESRIPVRASEMAHFHEKFHKDKNLVAWSFVDPRDPTKVVDLLIVPPLKKIKKIKIKVGGHSVVVATLTSIIEMKKLAARPADLADIARIETFLHDQEN